MTSLSAFPAIVIRKDETGVQSAATETVSLDDLMPGDVVVRVAWSTVNYKDGLAITGRMPVVRRFPMIPGIDLAGTVETSEHPDFRPGDAVLLNGWGVGEVHTGAYAAFARLSGDWLIPLPENLSPREAMAIGTAGYTAMLALTALERHRLTPADGPAVVTGAAGGVGSIAVALLAAAGWQVSAVTGRPAEADYLRRLGAAEIIDRAEFSGPPKPLARERWAAGIDAAGGALLAHLLSMTKRRGAIAACGNAGGMDLPGSMAPFILRGVALLGIDSVMAPKAERVAAWARLARDLDRSLLAEMTTETGFDGILDAARAIVDGRLRGRTVVRIAG